MANQPPKVHVDAVERTPIGNGEKFAASIARIGAALGMKKMGCTVVELEPGKRAWPYHLHYGQEELFIVLEGEGTLRYDGGEYEIRQGEIFFAPIGAGTAHQIINTSESMLKYLALSTMEEPELCYYPDSQKYGVYAGPPGERAVRFMAYKDAAVEYLAGEE